MSVNILLDMNLSPQWVKFLENEGFKAVHWSEVGRPDATDREIMDWAVKNRQVIFTHDLDFGTLLALTYAKGPSVIQLRTQNVLPDHIGHLAVSAFRQFEALLIDGALVVIDENKLKARVLPLNLASNRQTGMSQ